jgi:hypothetical protein
MSVIEIYYHQFDNADYESSPLHLEGVGYEPESLFSISEKKSIYYSCPAWVHKAKRTFLIRSPVNIDLTLLKNGEGLHTDSMTEYQFHSWVGPSTFTEKDWYSENLVTLQLGIPKFLFWTKHKNVWLELKPHALTSHKNNLIAIGGWWNLSEWERPTSFAFDLVDRNRKIDIKRGDIIQEVCFHTDNKNDLIKLIKKQPNKTLIERSNKILNIKRYIKGLSNDLIFKEKESKCPFQFLWKNTPQDKG